jgi:hypothetical protein
MNGTGRTSRASNEIATVVPLKLRSSLTGWW